MRIRPKIVKKKTFVSFDYQHVIDVDMLQRQKALTTDGRKIAYEFDSIAEKIYNLTHSPKITGRFDTTSERKKREFLIEKIREAKVLAIKREAEKENILEQVRSLQEKQKELLVELRKENSKFFLQSRVNAKEQREKEKKALSEGRFWECSEKTLKRFFRVPFRKRKLVDVSEKYRAAFFVELERRCIRNGRTALMPTHRGYLCGIDDNNEQWGFNVVIGEDREIETWDYSTTVASAMAEVWGVSKTVVETSYRQGELLFHPEPIPAGVVLHHEQKWYPAPSHCVESHGLQHNRIYFSSNSIITVSHPTHQPLLLQPGQYRVYIHGHRGID